MTDEAATSPARVFEDEALNRSHPRPARTGSGDDSHLTVRALRAVAQRLGFSPDMAVAKAAELGQAMPEASTAQVSLLTLSELATVGQVNDDEAAVVREHATWVAAERLYYDGPSVLRGVRFSNLTAQQRQEFFDFAAKIIHAFEVGAREARGETPE